MISIIVEVMGGVGLFLLGMGLMTEGLKVMAGDAIKGNLMRFTRSPISGVLTGTLSAAILQSSSATIIATVGFVGAGLLTFSQALGVVLGASIGTTFTGWLVAIVGFKFDFGAAASILVLLGAMLRLFGGTRRSGLAYGLAGFGLIFVGISTLQEGMSSLQSMVDFSHFSGNGFSDRLQLVLIGLVFTVVTQSSAAGVVAALAALHSNVILFEQAAALVIGMNTGTTFTSAVATIGGDANVRRTGFSHVVYNTIVGIGAVFLVGPYMWLWQHLWPGRLAVNSEIALVGFHTLFNLIGVMTVLPFIRYYARFIEHLFPEPVHPHERILDSKLLKYPELAITAAHKVLISQAQVLAQQVLYIVGDSTRAVSVAGVPRQLELTQHYVDSIHIDANASGDWERLRGVIHLVDHLQRLYDRCQNKAVLLVLHNADELKYSRKLLIEIAAPFASKQEKDSLQIQQLAADLRSHEDALRESITLHIAQGEIEMRQGVTLMEAARWVQRVASHLARIEAAVSGLTYKKRKDKKDKKDKKSKAEKREKKERKEREKLEKLQQEQHLASKDEPGAQMLASGLVGPVEPTAAESYRRAQGGSG